MRSQIQECRTISVDTVFVTENLDGVERPWRALADRVGASPFLHPEWFRAWRDAFDSEALSILVARRDDRITGVLPIIRQRAVLRSPTNWETPEFGPVAEDAMVVSALSKALFAVRPRRVVLRFLSGDDTVAAVRSGATRRGYRVLTHTTLRSPFVPIQGTYDSFDEYERTRSRGFRKDLRRRLRRLYEEGEVEFHVVAKPEDLPGALDEALAVEAAGWKGSDGTAILSRPSTARFYRRIARWGAEEGWLRLWLLRLDGQAIAMEFDLECAGRLYSVKAGFDSAYKRFAPGMILQQRVLRDAFVDGLSSYEMLGGDEGYKLQWTDQVRARLMFQAFEPSAAGLLEWGIQRYGRPVARWLQAAARTPD